MPNEFKCPKCSSENIYEDGNVWICPECSNEWTAQKVDPDLNSEKPRDESVRDAFGNILNDGDAITVIKDLKIKGSSSSVKVGTKVKNIRLVDATDGHNISCRIDGFGAMNLKSEFVKKV